ncbi:MAG TPA: alpha/beta fold hydrolase [Candidatus Acidoferrales bacterium]|nr:alpha/beta fold hydrolase [Candidatus Acidoferrales bacterium]
MAQDFDLELLRGRLRAERFGDLSSGVAALCVPGLSSNSRVFDLLGERYAQDGRCLISFDMRGRGWSEITAPGTYGWENHALDVLEAADALGLEHFDLVGHSMGAFVAMTAVSLDRGKRIRRLVLIDGLGVPSQTSIAAILAALAARKDHFTTADAFVAAVRSTGLVEPWSDFWEKHYRYDLVTENGNVLPRTSAAAVGEDSVYGAAHDPRALWPLLTLPTLLLRASVPMGGPDGFVVTQADYDEFLAGVPTGRGAEVAANHYGIVAAEETCALIENFLR